MIGNMECKVTCGNDSTESTQTIFMLVSCLVLCVAKQFGVRDPKQYREVRLTMPAISA